MDQFFTNLRSTFKAFPSFSRARQTKRRMAELEAQGLSNTSTTATANSLALPDWIQQAREESRARLKQRSKHWSAQALSPNL